MALHTGVVRRGDAPAPVRATHPGELRSEAALSSAYTDAGFADGAPTDGLVAPRLAEIQRRLRQSRDMDAVTGRLERYVSDSGSWHFQGGGGGRDSREVELFGLRYRPDRNAPGSA